LVPEHLVRSLSRWGTKFILEAAPKTSIAYPAVRRPASLAQHLAALDIRRRRALWRVPTHLKIVTVLD
jgi:hypothetical protein